MSDWGIFWVGLFTTMVLTAWAQAWVQRGRK